MTPNQKQPSSQIPKWDIAALIDLEYLSEEVETGDGNDLKQRDRAFFLSVRDGRKFSPEALASRPIILREWVTHRRQSPEFPEPGPGEVISEALDALRFWGFLVCVLVGATFAWGALNITGRLVNVILFWCLTVGIPFALTLIGYYFLLGEKFPRLPGPPGILRIWLCRLLVNVGCRTTRLLQRKSPQEHAIRRARLVGEIKRRTSGHGHLLMDTLGSLLHLLGLGLVTGIFLSVVLFRSFSYQDYGWQTHSGWLTETKLHSIVRMTSSPWAWFAGEGSGYPTEIQIRETRIFRNNGPTGGNPAASETWSSFLLWSCLVYGVLPRLGLYALGYVHLRRALARADFLKFDALWRRLTIPEVRMELPADENYPDMILPANLQDTGIPLHGPSLLLIPAELDAQHVAERLRFPLRNHDIEFDTSVSLPSLPLERQSLLQSLLNSPNVRPSRFLILRESFMPPNESFIRFLQKIRQSSGDNVPIHVVLLHDASAPQATQHLAAWHSRLDPLGDPLLSLVTISIEPEISTSSP